MTTLIKNQPLDIELGKGRVDIGDLVTPMVLDLNLDVLDTDATEADVWVMLKVVTQGSVDGNVAVSINDSDSLVNGSAKSLITSSIRPECYCNGTQVANCKVPLDNGQANLELEVSLPATGVTFSEQSRITYKIVATEVR